MRQSGVDNLKQEDEHEGGSLRMQVNSLEPGSYLDKGARGVGPKGIACGVEKSEVMGEAWKVDGHSAQSLVLVLGSSEKGKGCGVLDSVGGIMLPGQFVLESDHLCKVRVARSCMVSTTLWRGNWFIQLPLQVSDLSFLFTLLICVADDSSLRQAKD
jgi:hypothetical protein